MTPSQLNMSSDDALFCVSSVVFEFWLGLTDMITEEAEMEAGLIGYARVRLEMARFN